MLEQVVDNYTDGRYHVVAELLTTIFHEPPPKSRPGVTLPTRQTQLAILIDSLFKLKDYKVLQQIYALLYLSYLTIEESFLYVEII